MPNPVIEYAKEHPVPVAIGAVVIGLGLLWLFSSGSSAQAQPAGDPAAAYFAAASAQAQAGDAVQIAQIQGQTDVTKTLLNDQTAVTNATTWSAAQTTQTLNTNATEVALAPFGVESQAITGLSAAAQTPPITTTTTSQSHPGFFAGLLGLGSSKASTTTTTTPSPVAISAVDQLQAYLNGYAPGH